MTGIINLKNMYIYTLETYIWIDGRHCEFQNMGNYVLETYIYVEDRYC